MSVGKESILRAVNADAKKTESAVAKKPVEDAKPAAKTPAKATTAKKTTAAKTTAAKAVAKPAAKKPATRKPVAKKVPAAKTTPKKTETGVVHINEELPVYLL